MCMLSILAVFYWMTIFIFKFSCRKQFWWIPATVFTPAVNVRQLSSWRDTQVSQGIIHFILFVLFPRKISFPYLWSASQCEKRTSRLMRSRKINSIYVAMRFTAAKMRLQSGRHIPRSIRSHEIQSLEKVRSWRPWRWSLPTGMYVNDPLWMVATWRYRKSVADMLPRRLRRVAPRSEFYRDSTEMKEFLRECSLRYTAKHPMAFWR